MKKKYLLGAMLISTMMLHAQETPKNGETQKSVETLKVEETPKSEETLFDVLVPTEKETKADKPNNINVFLDSKFENKTTISSKEPTESGFQIAQARVYLEGNYKNKLRYYLRYRLNESVAKNALELAYFDYDINDKWTITVGKQFTAWGSWDLLYNASEYYMFSNEFSSLELFSLGAAATYKTAGQAFKLQVISQGEQFTAENYRNKAYAGLFLWEGSMFNEHFKTRYGYEIFQHDANRYYSWVTLGNQVNFDKVVLELDWMYGFHNLADKELTPFSVNTQVAYVKDNATVFSAKYHFKKFTPYVKAMYNYREDLDNNVAYSLTGISTALEYYPFEQAPFKTIRLYAAYNYLNYNYQKHDVRPSDKHEHQIAVGMRWNVPFF